MKNKLFVLLSLSILSVLVLTAFASATITFGTAPTLSMNGTSATINVTGTATENITFSLTSITENGKTITFTTPTSITNATGSAQIVTIPYAIPSGFEFYFGKTYSTTLTATGTLSGNATQTISFSINNPTEYTDNGNLDVVIDDLSVENGFGPDDNEWYPLDSIKAKIYVENKGSDKIKNIAVEWGLYDTENGEWIAKGKESKFTLNDGDDTTLTINFRVDKLNKIDLSNANNYKFYAWATGDDYSADPEVKTSTFDSNSITLDIDSDFVILNNFVIPETALCGSEVQITADIWNIGDEDQNDVYVVIYNKALGINKKVAIGDIDSMEDAKLETTLTLPEDMDKKLYDLQFSVYDENSDVYQNENDDKSVSLKTLNVEGACSLVPKVSVAATLQSDAKSGKELVIKATIANSGSDKETLNLGLSGYADWASLISMDKTALNLNAGQTGEVLITLKVNNDVSGEKKLDMVITEGDKILTQPIKVSIAKSSFQLPSSITGLFSGAQGNMYLWGIGALNVLLVLIIIVVAIKVAKKK